VEEWLNHERNLPGIWRNRAHVFHCGYLDERLAAVGVWFLDEEGDGEVWYFISALAVAWGHRHRGGRLADQLLEIVLGAIDADALSRGVSEVVVAARVHADNVPGGLLLEANGFRRRALHDEGLYRGWQKSWPAVPTEVVAAPEVPGDD